MQSCWICSTSFELLGSMALGYAQIEKKKKKNHTFIENKNFSKQGKLSFHRKYIAYFF